MLRTVSVSLNSLQDLTEASARAYGVVYKYTDMFSDGARRSCVPGVRKIRLTQKVVQKVVQIQNLQDSYTNEKPLKPNDFKGFGWRAYQDLNPEPSDP